MLRYKKHLLKSIDSTSPYPMTYRALADNIGISAPAVHTYCNNPVLPRIEALQKMADYFHEPIRRLIKNAAEKHGIPLRGPHDLRHAAGTDTLEATGDIRATQELLGHANIKSTQRYTHIAIKHQQRIAQLTAEFRKQQTKTIDKFSQDNT